MNKEIMNIIKEEWDENNVMGKEIRDCPFCKRRPRFKSTYAEYWDKFNFDMFCPSCGLDMNDDFRLLGAYEDYKKEIRDGAAKVRDLTIKNWNAKIDSVYSDEPYKRIWE